MNPEQLPFRPASPNEGSASGANQALVYGGISITSNAEVRRIWFSASSAGDAQDFCVKYGFACEGPAILQSASNCGREAYTVEEVMQLLQLSRSSVYRLIARGEIQRLRGMGSVRIVRRSLESYLSSSK